MLCNFKDGLHYGDNRSKLVGFKEKKYVYTIEHHGCNRHEDHQGS
jgi:hypothetical protein